jgi:hypothetical protein
MPLEHEKTMIKKFTYKELTLILGVLVALIIVLTLWVYQPSRTRTSFSIKRPSVVEVFKNSVIKTYVAVVDELR